MAGIRGQVFHQGKYLSYRINGTYDSFDEFDYKVIDSDSY